MAKSIHISILLAAALTVAAPWAHASGSVGPGIGPTSARGAYTLGKRLLFRELVCRSCPIPRRGFDRDRARDLKSSLDAVFDEVRPRTQDARVIRVLFTDSPEGTAANVAAVSTYLARRYKL